MIKIETHPVNTPLTGQSKWWGQPDLPDNLPFPEITLVDDDGEEYLDPLTFICQLRCEELAPFDPEGLLPHEGMLWFFAALDYFLGDYNTPAYPGMGEWLPKYFRVLHSPSCDNLHTHSIVYDDGSPIGLPAESITFSRIEVVHPESSDESLRLLGKPYLEEIQQAMPRCLSLLQIDENDRWNLTFHDCGMLNFLISPDSLRRRQWDKVRCYLFSF